MKQNLDLKQLDWSSPKKNIVLLLYVCRLTYREGSSRFWSFMSVGMRRVASGPEAKGFGSCPLNSDWMNWSCQLERSNAERKQNDAKLLMTEWCLCYCNIGFTHLLGRRKLLGKRCHSLPTHTLTGRPSGTVWTAGSLAMRWNSGYKSRGAW